MFSTEKYVPILKTKLGELAALGDLHSDVREQLIPLLEIHQRELDPETGNAKKPWREHLGGIVDRIAKHWGKIDPLMLDCIAVDGETVDEQSATRWMLDKCKAVGVRVVPVVSLRNSPAQKRTIAEWGRSAGTGFCVRITSRDLGRPKTITSRLTSLLRSLKIRAKDCELVVDLGAIEDAMVEALALVLPQHLRALPMISEWASITLAATAIPENMADQPRNAISRVARAEWKLHCALDRLELPRPIGFGDYGVQHPKLFSGDVRLSRMSPHIRYTDESGFVIVKGVAVPRKSDHPKKRNPPAAEQYPVLCGMLIEHPSWSGEEFSWADQFIARCAKLTGGPGSPTSWRRVGTGHHLTLVARQLASRRGA